MSEEGQVATMVHQALEAFTHLDIFVNNAARFVFAHATEVTEEGAALYRFCQVTMVSCHTKYTVHGLRLWVVQQSPELL